MTSSEWMGCSAIKGRALGAPSHLWGPGRCPRSHPGRLPHARENDNDNDLGDDEASEDDRAGDMDGGDAGTIRPFRNSDGSAD